MTDPRLLLDLFDGTDPYSDQEETFALNQLFQPQQTSMPNQLPSTQPVNLVGASDQLPQLPWQQSMGTQQAQTGDLMQRIQEALGAKEPNTGGTVSDILSSRFGDSGGPSYGDYAQGIVKSATGTPTLGADIGQSRTSGMLKQMENIANLEKLAAQTKLYNSGGQGNATIKAAQAIQSENPGMTFSEAFSFAKSGLGQGVTYGPNGVTTMQGAPSAAGSMAYGKEAGQRSAELQYAAPIGFAKDRGQAAGKASIDNTKSSMDLNNLDYSIAQAKSLVPKVSLTGPILGRVGNAANDPDYANLQGALNGITLQAKELYNLGSGQGFSDADRDFLGEVIAGKYSRAETINLALDRMSDLSKKRNQFLNQQNQTFSNEFGYGTPQTSSQPATSQPLQTPSGVKYRVIQ